MNDTIRAHLTLSFKGETQDIAAVIDLDQCAGGPDDAPNFHLLLARANGIDPYSYLYEVLEAHEIDFSEPAGLAAHGWRDGRFDWAEFVRARREEAELAILRNIAERTMGVTDLDGREGLKAALLAAYRAGRSECQTQV